MSNKPVGFGPLIRAVLVIFIGIPFLYLASIGACTPTKYQQYRFNTPSVEQEWGRASLASITTSYKKKGRTYAAVGPYSFSVNVSRISTAGKRFWLKAIEFVNAGDGTVALAMAPNTTNLLHLYQDRSHRYSGADLDTVELPYADYLVRVTFEIESGSGSNTYHIEFKLNRDYEEHWGIPGWEAFRWQ